MALRKYSGIERVCDLGCGSGKLVSELVSEGYNVIGVDYDAEGCRITADRNPTANVYNLGVHESSQSIIDNEVTFPPKLDP